jgi:hypothetical protein
VPKRKTPLRALKPKAAPARSPDLDRVLDALDAALLGGDTAAVEALVERLWAARRQAPDVLTQRLIDGRAQVPAFAFQLLQGTAGSRAPTYLRRVAEHRTVPDIVRFGAQRRAGWPERGEAKRRRTFLDTLQDPEGTLVVAAGQATSTWPPEPEILEEVVGYLGVLSSERVQAVLHTAAAELGDPAAWLLRAALHLADPPAQRLALAELVHLRDPAAAGAIGRLARTARDPGVRAEAEAALQRLGLHVVDAAPAEPAPLPPLHRAVVSMVDGAGGQVIFVVRQSTPGVHLFADFFHNETVGIKDTFGRSQEIADEATDAIAAFEDTGLGTVEVDLAAVRGILAAAVEVNAATGHPLPPVFELWEPFVHETYPPPADELVAPAELDDAPYAGHQDLLRASGRLADHPYFESWGFDPPDISAALLVTPLPRGGRLTDQQYRPLLEQLLPPATRQLFRQRLRRQAWLLDRAGEPPQRDQALAVAAHLPAASPADLARVPFWRKIAERSVANLAALVLLS